MITLGIETSANVAALALVRDGRQVHSLSVPDCLGRHAEETLPLLD